MAKKTATDDAIETTDGNEETTETAERRRQSPLTRAKFCINNLIGFMEEAGLSEVPEVVSAKNFLADNDFQLRPSTVVTAGKITQAMMQLDPMDDLTPRRIKKLGQLLGKAQKGELITDKDIEDAAGSEIDFEDDEDQPEGEAGVEAGESVNGSDNPLDVVE